MTPSGLPSIDSGETNRATVPTWRRAARHAADYLLRCQLPSGEITDPVGGAPSSFETLFRLSGGADIWHTVSAMRTLAAVTGQISRAASRYVRGKLQATGALSWASTRPGLCIETTAAAALVLPALRSRLRAEIRRHALPSGRWASFIIDGASGYDLYRCAPSVTAWALTALGPADSLVEAGRRYLAESCGPRGMWAAYDGAYATPFYPAHVATPWLSDPRPVLAYTLDTVGPTGGWGFGDPPGECPATLPTAWAVLTLLAGDPTLRIARAAAESAAQWLVAAQQPDGSLAFEPRPPSLWYTGPVYATAVAALVLTRLADRCQS